MLLKEQGGPISDKQRKMLEEAERSCGRINSIVAEMSEFGKLQSTELALARQPVDLAALAAEVAADMHEGDERGVQIEARGTGAPIHVNGDRTRLASTLKALIFAAVRERAEPGVIVVECSTIQDTLPRWAVVAIGIESTLAQLAGMARGTPPPFDEWRGGIGLALPVGRRVIEALGGAIWSATGDQSRAASGLRLPLDS
jgi:signal transduction histidine kinase